MNQVEKLKIDLPLVLPHLPDERDACVERLISSLKKESGISEAHVIAFDHETPKLCIHYDSDKLSLKRVREITLSNGANIEDRFGHLTKRFTQNLTPRKASRIETSIRELNGIIEASFGATGVLDLEFDKTLTTKEKILKTIDSDFSSPKMATVKSPSAHKGEKQDHEAHSHDDHDHSESGDGHSHEHSGILGENTELYFAIAAAVTLAIGWGLSIVGVEGLAPKALYFTSYFFGGFFALKEALENLRQKRLQIDSLMVLAAVGAGVLGEWPEGALLLVLFSVGHSLEHYAMGRARKAVEALSELAPESARVRRNGVESEIPLSDLKVEDIVLVKPNERIAADGFVVKGESSVDQSPVTGESVPVDKSAMASDGRDQDRALPIHRVFSGTINGSGSLEIQVTKLSSESTLSKVIQMVNEAEAKKSPTQLFTDKFEKIFVPCVLVFIAILPFAFLVISETWQVSLYRAMSVLVAASPCALAIATPSAVLSAVARAAKGGVLVKGGAPLEELGQLTAIAFDKTGTLTEGKPKVVDVRAVKGEDPKELLAIANSVEKLSDHPLAAAIVTYAKDNPNLLLTGSFESSSVKSITGKGVSAVIGQKTILIGKTSLFDDLKNSDHEIKTIATELESKGRTVMIVKQDSKFLGAIGLMDQPRESAKGVIAKLESLGVKKMIMLSGDNQTVADAVAKELNLTEAKGDLMPEDKVRYIQEMRKSQKVAMVGDGVNDAPAMTQATVAIAMGAAGSDVALQTADIALMSDNLSALPFAVGLSRKSRRIVKQNLYMSLGMVAFLIPATLFGLKMGLAVVGHEGSTVLVVLNALRLLAYKDPQAV